MHSEINLRAGRSLMLGVLTGFLFLFPSALFAQDTVHISLNEAIQRGIDSSKVLQQSANKIDQSIARYDQAKDLSLPKINVGVQASEAFILTQKLDIEGLTKDPIYLPSHTTAYVANAGIEELIFAGNRIRYGKEAARQLQEIARLTAQNDTEGVQMHIIESYINLYNLDQNIKIVERELVDVQGRLDEVKQFRDNGLATDNDVLRFELQKARAKLNKIDLDNNRAVANYAMDILLGIPEGTFILVDSVGLQPVKLTSLADLTDVAQANRKELPILDRQNQVSDLNIKQINGAKLPNVGVGASGYFINPNSQFIPPKNAFLLPTMVGVNINWDVTSLYTSKHKLREAKLKKEEIAIQKRATEDEIKNQVSRQYHDYIQSLKKIPVLETAVSQAKENDRIMELKYQNQLATTTDRIDAQTMLYQSLVNLEIARAEAVTNYYKLLRTTGTLNK